MIKLRIDNIDVEVPEGTTVLEAAAKVGIDIPSMCFLKGFENSPSCMVCLIKDKVSGELKPSCVLPAVSNMEIVSDDEEVFIARRKALELLLSDHVGDCEAPCRRACPAFMNIPEMNRLICSGNYSESIKIVKQEIALALVLGYICPSPCEKACRRKQIDEPVSICQLKKFSASEDIKMDESWLPPKKKKTKNKVAIIGSGPAGMASAFHLLQMGHDCCIFDGRSNAGGNLRKIPEDELPVDILEAEINLIKQYGAQFILNTLVTEDFLVKKLNKEFDAIIFATGNIEDSNITLSGIETGKKGIVINKDTFETPQSGIFACGNAVGRQKMAVRAVAQGKAAAFSVDAYLNKLQAKKIKKLFNSSFGKLMNEELGEYMKESDPIGKISPVNGDLKGFSAEEAIKEASRCLHCDCRKADNCKLRVYSDIYQADKRKFVFGQRKTIEKVFDHEKIVYELEKCIKCSLCVEITVKNKELVGLTHVGRGFDIKIEVPLRKNMTEALTQTGEKCVNACPTGALAFKIRDKG